MTSTLTPKKQSIQYSERTITRAERALRCSLFQLPLFMAMRDRSVPLQTIAGKTGYEQNYTHKPLSEQRVENGLVWLITVGLLRREVDGQGITDSFRLTPLGRQLVQKWEEKGGGLPAPSWGDRIYNAFIRWFRLPF
ncbi:MAG: Npun_F0494 family protein [Chroococcales cyanobacterium]